MRRFLLLLAGLLILLAVAMPTVGVYYLTFTQGGLRFLVDHVPREVAGARLEIAQPEGTIAHGMRVGHIEIDHHLVHLRLEGVAARIELLPLLWQTIHADNFSIHRIAIQVKRRTRPPIPSAPLFLPRWLIIIVDQAHVDSASLTVPNGTRLEATELHASGTVRHHRIRFYDIGLQLAEMRLVGTGELQAADPLGLQLQARVGWTPAGQPAWSLAMAAQGDLNALRLTAQTSAPFHCDFTGQALDLTGQWHWLGQASVHDFDLTSWGGSAALGILAGDLVLRGHQNGFAARGPLTSSGLHAGIFDVRFEGAFADHVLWAKRIEVLHRDSHALIAGGGTIAIVNPGPRIDLRGSWHDFRWPLAGKDAPFHSVTGEYIFSGIWPYSVRLNGIATIRNLPATPVRLRGSLARDGFTFDQAELQIAEGRMNLTGGVFWSPAHSWGFSGRASDINPGQFRTSLPGKIAFGVSAQGKGFGEDGDFDVDVRDIGGRLRGVAAGGGGRVARTGATWRFDNVHLALGHASFALDGTWNDRFDLRFGLVTQDLSVIAADSRGQLVANGTLRGTLRQPTVVASAHGSGIQHAGVTVDALDANIEFDPNAQYESHISAHIRNLTYQNRTLENLSFGLNGKPNHYAARLDATALGLAAAVQASGPFADGIWHGQLDSVAIIGTELLHLQLERPAALTVSPDAVRADWMCLVGKPASLCADGDWSAKRWNATFTGNEIPLATVTAGASPSVQYGGRINVHGKLFGGAEAPAQATMRLDLSDAQLSHRLSSGRTQTTSIGSGLVTIDAGTGAIDAAVALESGEVGTIKGHLQAQRVSSRWQDLPIRGELHAHTEQLGLITLYLPEIDRAAGHLDADMRLAGTLGTPLMSGELRISAGEIDYFQVNLGLRQLAFEAHLTDSGLDFKGSTRIGSGLADANGRLEWRKSLPHGEIHLNGSNLRVVDVPEAQIDASPELDFNIDGRRIETTGAVKVPYAKIVPKDLTGAVRSSADEVIVGQEQTDPSKRFEVLSNITLNLGDHVSVDTTGLTGRLTGNVTVRSGYDAGTSATGELSIEQGKYTAYARKLDIQRGRLIFTGGPIGNPGIDIRAIKVFPDVTAGVNVRGTLLQPRLSFFSDPSLTQSQIVSLILAGGSLESAQNRQSTAGNELLAQGGAMLAQQFGSRVGIEDVSLESDLTNDTSLVLGRYLSPRVYVSYGIGLTQQLNVLKLRYSLGDHWTVKTEVGQARGADLVYTIAK